MIEFNKPFPGGGANTIFKKDRKVKTVQFDQITADGDTVVVSTTGMPKGTYYVKVTGTARVEFQGSSIGGPDDDDWVNQDDRGRTFLMVNDKEAYSFEEYANFVKVKVTNMTGGATVDIVVILGE